MPTGEEACTLYKAGAFETPSKLSRKRSTDRKEYLFKCGRTTGWTVGEDLDVELVLYEHREVWMYAISPVGPENNRSKCFSKKGDSGALVFDVNGKPIYHLLTGLRGPLGSDPIAAVRHAPMEVDVLFSRRGRAMFEGGRQGISKFEDRPDPREYLMFPHRKDLT